MDKVTLIIKYWQMVISTSWEVAIRRANMKGFALAVIGALLILVCLIILNSYGILPEEYRLIVGDFSAEVRTNIIYWAGAIILALIIFTFSLIYIPAKIDQEKENKIRAYEPDQTKIIVAAYENFSDQRVGIEIKNLTSEDFVGVIELTNFGWYVVDQNCDEEQWPFTIDKGNCHFQSPNVSGHDHQVIDLAELQDDKIVFLTGKTISMMIEFFFARPKPIPKPDFVKLYFALEFELRGKFKKNSFQRRYETLVTVRLNKISSSILIGEVSPALQKTTEQ